MARYCRFLSDIFRNTTHRPTAVAVLELNKAAGSAYNLQASKLDALGVVALEVVFAFVVLGVDALIVGLVVVVTEHGEAFGAVAEVAFGAAFDVAGPWVSRSPAMAAVLAVLAGRLGGEDEHGGKHEFGAGVVNVSLAIQSY